MSHQVDAARCGNCGANLSPNMFDRSVKCGFCGTEYATATTKKAGQDALASVKSVSGTSEKKPTRPVEPGTFYGFLWMCALLYFGVAVAGWALARVPHGGMLVLVPCGIAAVVILTGRVFPAAPAAFVGISRHFFQYFAISLPTTVLLVCVGFSAISIEQVEKRNADRARKEAIAKAESIQRAKEKAAADAAERARQERIDFNGKREGLLAALEKGKRDLRQGRVTEATALVEEVARVMAPILEAGAGNPDEVADVVERNQKLGNEIRELELKTTSYFVAQLKRRPVQPKVMKGLLNRTVNASGVAKEDILDVVTRRIGEVWTFAPTSSPVKQKPWMNKPKFLERCGAAPGTDEALLRGYISGTLEGTTVKNVFVVDLLPDKKRCWVMGVVWTGEGADEVSWHRWDVELNITGITAHQVLFPR